MVRLSAKLEQKRINVYKKSEIGLNGSRQYWVRVLALANLEIQVLTKG